MFVPDSLLRGLQLMRLNPVFQTALLAAFGGIDALKGNANSHIVYHYIWVQTYASSTGVTTRAIQRESSEACLSLRGLSETFCGYISLHMIWSVRCHCLPQWGLVLWTR